MGKYGDDPILEWERGSYAPDAGSVGLQNYREGWKAFVTSSR